MVNRIFDKLLPPRRPRPPRLLTALAIWLIAISILPIVIGSANLAGLYLARNEGNAWLIPLLFFSTLLMSYWMMVFIVVLPVIGLAYIISGFFLLTGSRTAYWMTLILLGIGAIVNLFLVLSFISAIENIQNLPTVTDSSSFYSPLFFSQTISLFWILYTFPADGLCIYYLVRNSRVKSFIYFETN